MIKQTPFYSKHIEAGAKMVDFFGFSLPIYYEGINIEHKHVRDSVGVFDVSHMGQFILEGEQVFNFLQKVTTNDVSKIKIGSVQYSCMTNEEGMVLDDLLVSKKRWDVHAVYVPEMEIDIDTAENGPFKVVP